MWSGEAQGSDVPWKPPLEGMRGDWRLRVGKGSSPSDAINGDPRIRRISGVGQHETVDSVGKIANNRPPQSQILDEWNLKSPCEMRPPQTSLFCCDFES